MVTILGSVWALWSDEQGAVPASAPPGRADTVAESNKGVPSIAAMRGAPGLASSSALPKVLERPDLEPAERDPFVPSAVAPPPPPPAVVPAPVVAMAPAPPPPQEVRYRFLGQMVTPQGERLVYLGWGEQAVAVKAGDRLEDGFVVDSLDGDGVHLVLPISQQRAVIPISTEP